jgi:hypothetical protein
MGLSFTIAAGPRQSSHSQVRGPRHSWPHFTVSDSRLPQPGGPGPRIYITQEQGGPVVSLGIGFLFRGLLRLAGLRWRYSNLPSHGRNSNDLLCPIDKPSARTAAQKTHLLYCCVRALPSNGCFSDSTLLVLSKYATIWTEGYVLAQEISRRLLTAAAWVRSEAMSCAGQSDALLRRFPLSIPIPPDVAFLARASQIWHSGALKTLVSKGWVSLCLKEIMQEIFMYCPNEE